MAKTGKRVKRSPPDLLVQLQEQTMFLLTSAKAYDDGQTSEAKRLAQSIRVLVYQGKTGAALLGQLGKLAGLFFDTALLDPLPSKHHAALIGSAEVGGVVRAVPPLGSARDKRRTPFADWWNGVVLIDGKGNQFSRQRLILLVANQDGGAHVDPLLDQCYWELTRANSMDWESFAGGSSVEDVALATVRQIAHEVLKTLDPAYECSPAVRPNQWMISGTQLIHW